MACVGSISDCEVLMPSLWFSEVVGTQVTLVLRTAVWGSHCCFPPLTAPYRSGGTPKGPVLVAPGTLTLCLKARRAVCPWHVHQVDAITETSYIQASENHHA